MWIWACVGKSCCEHPTPKERVDFVNWWEVKVLGLRHAIVIIHFLIQLLYIIDFIKTLNDPRTSSRPNCVRTLIKTQHQLIWDNLVPKQRINPGNTNLTRSDWDAQRYVVIGLSYRMVPWWPTTVVCDPSWVRQETTSRKSFSVQRVLLSESFWWYSYIYI